MGPWLSVLSKVEGEGSCQVRWGRGGTGTLKSVKDEVDGNGWVAGRDGLTEKTCGLVFVWRTF